MNKKVKQIEAETDAQRLSLMSPEWMLYHRAHADI